MTDPSQLRHDGINSFLTYVLHKGDTPTDSLRSQIINARLNKGLQITNREQRNVGVRQMFAGLIQESIKV